MRSAQMIEDEEEVTDNQAEFSLGMGSLIGIFFGLALVCGVFFGFGYMMGHRAPGPMVPSEPLYVAPASAAPVAPKPSAQVAAPTADASSVVVPTGSPSESSSATDETADAPAPAPVPSARPAGRTASNAPAPSPVATPISAKVSTEPTGSIMVQIAAVRNQADAEALAAALQKNGFTPTIRTESQDKLIHVQIGPFSSRDEAKSMRQKLANAGYNAFIK